MTHRAAPRSDSAAVSHARADRDADQGRTMAPGRTKQIGLLEWGDSRLSTFEHQNPYTR